MDQLRFSIPEILSLIGVIQCVYILVYMAFRSGRISRASLAILYFLVLGTAFAADFARNSLGTFTPYYFYIQWAGWFLGPPLSVLLVVQIAKIHEWPPLRNFWVLLLIPLAFFFSQSVGQGEQVCRAYIPCPERIDALLIAGIVAGALSLLTIWFNRDIFTPVLKEKDGKTRYWVILAIILMNILFLFSVLLGVGLNIESDETRLIRTILGLGYVYLVGTGLFRIYPQAVQIRKTPAEGGLTAEEREIAAKIEGLLTMDKVYQEPTYARNDLARECGASEAVISKVINVHYQKSLPQIMNEYRIQDAKQLLRETAANVKDIAGDVGFNSLASFNRVFKDMTNQSPSAYRKSHKKEP